MGKLTPEQQAQLDELQKLSEAPDDEDEDYEIEIYAPDGSGARVPYRKGKSWLAKTFGIDADSLSKPDDTSKSRKPATRGKTADAAGNADDPAEGDATSDGGSQLKLFRQRQQGRSAS